MIRLLIKTHKVTGLKYLCVTNKDNFVKYRGSGIYWTRHLNKHGVNITTRVLYEAEKKNIDFKNVCLYYSMIYDVVNSSKWANLIPENGNTVKHNKKTSVEGKKNIGDGIRNFYASSESDDTRKKISDTSKKYWNIPEHRQKMIAAAKKASTPVVRAKISKTISQYITNMTTEEKNNFNKSVSKGILSMSDESKHLRAERIRESFKKSESHFNYVERMKIERIGSGNPAAKRVFWKGEIFLTRKDFEAKMKERGLSVRRCREIIDDCSIEDCYVENQMMIKEAITCPHCGKKSTGRKHSAMKKYHFDKCKFKESNENKIDQKN